MNTVTTAEGLNDDFTATVKLETAAMPWAESPSPDVFRKRLELSGPAEAGRVTSIVRYEPGSRFPSHPHPDGEEILVLDGVFSDEHGDYPAGTYLLNPEGFSHAPFSKPGCVLFVKLRQYPGARPKIALDIRTAPWRNYGGGRVALTLFDDAEFADSMSVIGMEQDAVLDLPEDGHGAEIFVIAGHIEDVGGGPDGLILTTGDWMRSQARTPRRLVALAPTTLYLKTGHL